MIAPRDVPAAPANVPPSSGTCHDVCFHYTLYFVDGSGTSGAATAQRGGRHRHAVSRLIRTAASFGRRTWRRARLMDSPSGARR